MVPFFVQKALIRAGLARATPIGRAAGSSARGHWKRYADRVLAAPIATFTDPAAFPDGPAADGINLNLAAPRGTASQTLAPTVDLAERAPIWGSPALREQIQSQSRLTPENVLITHGATGAFTATLDAFVNPGDGVTLFTPGSPLFAAGVQSRRGRLHRVATVLTDTGELDCDLLALERAVRRSKLVVLADPSNPTGGTLTNAALDRLVWAANRYDVVVYVDETFSRSRSTGLTSRADGRTRLLVAGSASARCGWPGARVGWLAGPKALVGAAALTMTLTAPTVSGAMQQIVARHLADDTWNIQLGRQLDARRDFAVGRLNAAGLPTRTPRAGYFLWVDVSPTGRTGRAVATELMATESVLVGPGDVFGSGGDSFIRISVAEEDGRLREGLARLTHFVAQLRGDEPAPPPARPPVVTRPAVFSRA